MKKILTASLVAMMAVSAANADIASTNYVTKSIDALNGAEAVDGAASGSYVVSVSQSKGVVKPTVVKFIDDEKNIVENEKNAPTAGAVADYVEGKLGALTTGSGSLGDRVDVLEKTLSDEGGLLDQVEALDENKQDELGASNVKTNGTTGVITSITATDGVVTATKAQIGTADIADNAGIKKTQLESSVQTSLGKADTAVQNFNSLVSSSTGSGTVVKGVSQTAGKVAVTMGQIATADIADNAGIKKTQLESSVQTSLEKADSAVQSVTSGSTNGTIDVDGEDVAVTGLGSAAYTASTAYATSAQGTKIDSIADATKLAAGQGDGTYTLTMTVTNNQPTYKWEMINRGN